MTDENKKSPLSDPGNLSSSFRRFALRTTLAASILGVATPGANGREDTEPRAALEGNVGDAGAASPPLSVREKKRRGRIRDTLLNHARDDLDALEALTATGYSRDLQQLQDHITGSLQASHSTVHDKAVFVDPEKLDVALSLGFAPEYAVSRLLAEQKIHIPDNQVEQAGQKAATYYDSKFGVITYTQDATAITNLKDLTPEACVVIPSSERTPTAGIAGLTRAEQVQFTNTHESYHCLDGKYNLRHLDPKKVEAVKKGTLLSQINDRTALEIYATVYRKEAFADLGGAGDMIRAGKGLDLIDKLAAWRASDTKDLQHLSSPVLKGLKDRIQEMGLDNFRKLSTADAQKLYFEVTDEYGMTAKSIQTTMRFASATGTEKQSYLDRARTDPDVARALVLMSYLVKAHPQHPAAALSGTDRALAGELKKWDADKLLDDKAFEMGGKITPSTIIKAYNALQDDLHGKMTASADNKLYPLQAAKLQQAFLTHARELDYVAVNAARGVDIVKTEPALKTFADPPKKNLAAAAPAGQ